MCHLAFVPPGVAISDDRLLNAASANDDGHGFAFVVGGKILTYKDMRAETAIELFQATRTAYPDAPALWHSRWATHGVVDTSNVHPFVMTGDSQTVFAHNGVINGLRMAKTEWRSDTRFFAEEILPQLSRFDRPRVLARLDGWAGSGKFVILTANPRYQRSAYIVGESRGDWDKGVWHSNRDYVNPRDRYAGWAGWGDEWDWDRPTATVIGKPDDGPTACNLCESPDDFDVESQYCFVCGTCNDCYMAIPDCDCYMPASVRTGAPGWAL
jgi:glutamine amidotransferase